MSQSNTKFGQIVVGPPMSGKTTYCKTMAKLLQDHGREVAIINLDPANDSLPYTAAADIKELISVESVMETEQMGPNGALVFCMNFLLQNIDWLTNKINSVSAKYFIFDFPGQAELYTHHSTVRDLMNYLEKIDLRFCSVFLVDAHYASDTGKYVSALLLTLTSMLHLACPSVNILSKVDTIEQYKKLEFGLDYYTEVLDLSYLFDSSESLTFSNKFDSLTKKIAEVVTDYSLVSFIPMAVENRQTLLAVMKACDKANGYVFGSSERDIKKLMSCAVGANFEHDNIGAFRDTYADSDSEEEILKILATQKGCSSANL